MPMPRKLTPEKHCQHCQARLYRKVINGRLEDLGAFNRRKYCDQECMATAFVKDAPSNSALSKRAEKFRGLSCEVCGDTKMVAAHHVDGNRKNNLPENIQSLCASCHATHHHRAHRVGLAVAGRMASRGLSALKFQTARTV